LMRLISMVPWLMFNSERLGRCCTHVAPNPAWPVTFILLSNY
jgi:hypothetical protein